MLSASSGSMNSSLLAVPTYTFPTFTKFIKYSYLVSKHHIGSKDIMKFVPFGRAMLLERKKFQVSST